MENEALIPIPTSQQSERTQNDTSQQSERTRNDTGQFFFCLVVVLLALAALVIFCKNIGKLAEEEEEVNPLYDVTIPSLDFTVLNMTETRLSVKWDLLIRIPPRLPGPYVCLIGYFKAFIAYNGVTIATSPIESYTLKWLMPMVLQVSLTASEGDMDGAIMKNIVEDIKARGEVRFGLRLLFPDCTYGSSGKMNYVCDEATLRFKPDSQRDAALVENQPHCPYQL
ncbi:unnamed protein product [Eruca vesicaria subsp. sativa]|uniref:Late embryogenesis abundant protein LEA-2 subgroup domain-containing protein n=1 Tax=Eruca vesicaria subsp. sativa TaxID=29727 RepID=A0ABC8IU92_ERUVS|nr:unnamed protein product [Eruca vesicaria subsp. sativa]